MPSLELSERETTVNRLDPDMYITDGVVFQGELMKLMDGKSVTWRMIGLIQADPLSATGVQFSLELDKMIQVNGGSIESFQILGLSFINGTKDTLRGQATVKITNPSTFSLIAYGVSVPFSIRSEDVTLGTLLFERFDTSELVTEIQKVNITIEKTLVSDVAIRNLFSDLAEGNRHKLTVVGPSADYEIDYMQNIISTDLYFEPREKASPVQRVEVGVNTQQTNGTDRTEGVPFQWSIKTFNPFDGTISRSDRTFSMKLDTPVGALYSDNQRCLADYSMPRFIMAIDNQKTLIPAGEKAQFNVSTELEIDRCVLGRALATCCVATWENIRRVAPISVSGSFVMHVDDFTTTVSYTDVDVDMRCVLSQELRNACASVLIRYCAPGRVGAACPEPADFSSLDWPTW